jgi:hypothetical protein
LCTLYTNTPWNTDKISVQLTHLLFAIHPFQKFQLLLTKIEIQKLNQDTYNTIKHNAVIKMSSTMVPNLADVLKRVLGIGDEHPIVYAIAGISLDTVE